MALVWLDRACKTGAFVMLTGLASGCALDTSAIGLPEAGKVVANDSVERPTPRRDASTQASSADDAHVPSAGGAKPGARTSDAGAGPRSDAGADSQDDPSHDDGGSDASSHSSDAGPEAPPFPAIDDPWQAGPYTPVSTSGANHATVFAPMELGSGGQLHPIVIWDNIAGLTGPSGYQGVLQHLASHG
ncbi:MAG: hypothetical protein RLZZ450_5369, partial [Pseudomonadota bacterium]